jgi:hypothetical protein
MRANEIENDLELQRVLWACYRYWQGEALPPHERVICYSWVVRLYEDRFDAGFHQSKLRRLAGLGFLQQDDTSRGGNRRYYMIVDPNRVASLLKKWKLI